MTDEVFEAFRLIALEQAGIRLHPDKASLVKARLAKRIRGLGLRDEGEYLALLRDDASGRELVQFFDCISTNYTLFFREKDHFDDLTALVQARLASGQRRFRFWSAGCSSGEEPFTMALVLRELFEGLEVDWRILATDISTRVLGRAAAATYTVEQLRLVPPAARTRYFERVDDEPGRLRVSAEIRRHVVFARLNLGRPPFGLRGPLDAVFCRNVMIYFADSARRGLVGEVQRLLGPEGLFLIGHSETLNGVPCSLRLVRPSVYQQAPLGGAGERRQCA